MLTDGLNHVAVLTGDTDFNPPGTPACRYVS
jgi:hypothetical protein